MSTNWVGRLVCVRLRRCAGRENGYANANESESDGGDDLGK